ncbi:NUDIX domain-containing protein [bacterium]|nr:NUDIX domain-containing protein [bacterium]MBU1024533.1 NUDIX domain-containing protein [bacterium]
MTDEKPDIQDYKYQELGIPRITARGLCKHQGNVFLEYDTSQSEIDRIYSLPGGAIKWGERALDTLKREFKEEFNMDVSAGRFLTVIENKFGTSSGRVHTVELIFEVSTQSSNFEPLVSNMDGKWIDINGIDRINLKPDELREAIFTQSINRRKHIIAGDMKVTG